MCGVVSIVYRKNIANLGNEAASLLKKLEYRGYDSTGGAFIKEDGTVTLRKKVGAPSRVIEQLEIPKQSGFKFIGQVRWATYGAVTDVNAQPHEVNCLVHMVGAHNGNVSNTDKLKDFLADNGHTVLSNNDGEMVVHLVEHFYSALMHKCKPSTNDEK
ncbi:MAG TPA: glutamine--fructose-6-phosphate aminotransferase, partial [bacterium]|nr:glutamine--fructose-6-phosphate aminotransferase [bacterium]